MGLENYFQFVLLAKSEKDILFCCGKCNNDNDNDDGDEDEEEA